MINLNTRFRSVFPSNTYPLCHHRLSIDYQELFGEKPRYISEKCLLRIEPPQIFNGDYVFNCDIMSKEGFYKDILFQILIIVPKDYPFVPPKIVSLTKVLHPNIHIETGEVYLNALKKSEWNPVLNLNCILFGLELLIIQPDISYTPDYPQNQELLEIYQRDLHLFEKLVRENSFQYNYSDMSNSIAIEEPIEENSNLMVIEKQLSQMKMDENMIRSDNIVKSLKYDFEKYEPKKFDLFQNYNENSNLFNNNNNNNSILKKQSKKRKHRDEESLINPFLKKVRITPV